MRIWRSGWWSALGCRLDFGWELPIPTETRSDKQPNFGLRMTPTVYASEIGVRVCGFGDFILGVPLRLLKHVWLVSVVNVASGGFERALLGTCGGV